MPNVALTKLEKTSAFRKVAIGTWQTAYDPTVYGSLKVRMEKAEQYIAAFRKKTGKRLTITHMVTAATARALAECRDANAILRFNKIYLRQHVNISVLVVIPSPDGTKVDLSAAVVRDADKLSLVEQIESLERQVGGIRTGKDKALSKSKDTIRKVPFVLMNLFLKLLAFLLYDLNLDLRFLGLPKDQFGGATVTNVGSLGLDVAFVPIAPYTRVPIWIAPGAIMDEPVVEGDKVVPGRTMSINASFDHRFIDGFHAMILSRSFRRVMENPFEELDSLDDDEPGEVPPSDDSPAEDLAAPEEDLATEVVSKEQARELARQHRQATEPAPTPPEAIIHDEPPVRAASAPASTEAPASVDPTDAPEPAVAESKPD